MKKFILLITSLVLCSQLTWAKDVEHKVAQNMPAQSADKPEVTLSRFKVCNKLSYPIFFIAWAIDTPNSYRYNDWIQPYECRTDKFDRYFDVSLYEFSTAPYETPFLDYVLRNGYTLNITPAFVANHKH